MFVREDARGAKGGTAKVLLDTLLGWARARRIEEIYLGTNEEFLAAHRFYEKHGFAEIPREHLPSKFPDMAVDSKFYVLRVSVPSTGGSRYRGRDAKSYPS